MVFLVCPMKDIKRGWNFSLIYHDRDSRLFARAQSSRALIRPFLVAVPATQAAATNLVDTTASIWGLDSISSKAGGFMGMWCNVSCGEWWFVPNINCWRWFSFFKGGKMVIFYQWIAWAVSINRASDTALYFLERKWFVIFWPRYVLHRVSWCKW